jgi:Xaa-Pro aminopeptidase
MLLNRERALDLMQRFSVDALVAATRENVIYTSDFAPWGQAVHKYSQRPNFVVFCRQPDQTPAMLMYPGEATYFAAQNPWLQEVYTYGGARTVHYNGAEPPAGEEERFISVFEKGKLLGKSPAEALAQLLRAKGLSSATVAWDHEGIAQEVKDHLRTALPQAKFLDASDLFRLIRMIKSKDEIQGLRKACELNDRSVTAMFKSAAAGATELELAAEFHKQIGTGRGSVGWQHLGSGRRSAGIFPPSPKKLEPGDLLRTDVGIYLNSLHSDVCATGVLGEATKRQQKLFDAGAKGIAACLDLCQPGRRPSELLDALNRGTQEAGVDEHKEFVGHTIGIEAREFPFEFTAPKKLNSPFLPETSDVPLQENMVINVEVALVELGMGGIQIEHTLLIKKDGFEFMTAEPRELMALG